MKKSKTSARKRMARSLHAVDRQLFDLYVTWGMEAAALYHAAANESLPSEQRLMNRREATAWESASAQIKRLLPKR